MKQIKNLRMQVDSLVISARTLTPSREVSLCITNMQRSFMWMGKMLKELGEPNPYPKSMDPESKEIEPMADRAEHNLSDDWKGENYDQVAKVKALRAGTESVISLMKQVFKGIGESELILPDNKISIGIYSLQSNLALEEAKLWLGMELRRIADEAAKK